MTTTIDIDYYEELKRKADALDEKEKGTTLTYSHHENGAYSTLIYYICGNCLTSEIQGHFEYCPVCGYKIVDEN